MEGSGQLIQQVSDFLQTLTWIDYIVVLGIGRGIFTGFKSGGFVELVRWTVLILTLAVLVAFTGVLAGYVQDHTLLSEGVSKNFVIVTLGLLVFLLIRGISKIILKFASMENNWVMKILGVTLGGLRWMVLLSFALFALRAVQAPILGKDVLADSRWGGTIEPIAPSIVDFATGVIPQDLIVLKDASTEDGESDDADDKDSTSDKASTATDKPAPKKTAKTASK